jgi:hypothetical protein
VPLGSPWTGQLPDIEELRAILPAFAAIVVTWLVIMAVTGWLAGRRGRDDGLWAVIGLLLGPVAPVLLLLLPRRERTGPLETMPPTPPGYTGEWPAREAPGTTLDATDDWPVLVRAAPPLTQAQRLLGGGLGGVGGVAGAGALKALGATEPIELLLLLGGAAGTTIGYLLSGALLEADRARVAWIGVAAGMLALSVAALLIGLAGFVQDVAANPTAIAGLPVVLLAAAIYPVVLAFVTQGILAVGVLAGLGWAALTSWLLRPRAAASDQVPSAVAG